MRRILIKNATLINEGYAGIASVLIEGDKIAAVYPEECTIEMERNADEVVDAFGKWLLPGVIDDQVHFREPGLTYKADMHSESMAAVAGGVTSCRIRTLKRQRKRLSTGNLIGQPKPQLPIILFIWGLRMII